MKPAVQKTMGPSAAQALISKALCKVLIHIFDEDRTINPNLV